MWKCLNWSGGLFTVGKKYKGYYKNKNLWLYSNINKYVGVLEFGFKNLNYFNSTFGRLKSLFI